MQGVGQRYRPLKGAKTVPQRSNRVILKESSETAESSSAVPTGRKKKERGSPTASLDASERRENRHRGEYEQPPA